MEIQPTREAMQTVVILRLIADWLKSWPFTEKITSEVQHEEEETKKPSIKNLLMKSKHNIGFHFNMKKVS